MPEPAVVVRVVAAVHDGHRKDDREVGYHSHCAVRPEPPVAEAQVVSQLVDRASQMRNWGVISKSSDRSHRDQIFLLVTLIEAHLPSECSRKPPKYARIRKVDHDTSITLTNTLAARRTETSKRTQKASIGSYLNHHFKFYHRLLQLLDLLILYEYNGYTLYSTRTSSGVVN